MIAIHEVPTGGVRRAMEPIVQTLEVVAGLDLEADGELLRLLRSQSTQMHALVPDIVGMSVGNIEHDLTLTWAATSAEIAVLDLSPRLDDAPALADCGCGRDCEHILDEQHWLRLAQATAAAAVAASLTLPVVSRDVVLSRVDLYAGSWDAFDGLHQEISFVFGAWAPGAVINADLSFSTREDAERGPERLRVSTRIQIAVGVIAGSRGIDLETAQREFSEAARRAGLTEGAHAEVVIERERRAYPD